VSAERDTDVDELAALAGSPPRFDHQGDAL